jgi:hypothetical protein
MADKPGLSTLKNKGREITMAEISAICWNQLQKVGTEKHRKYHLPVAFLQAQNGDIHML